MFIFKVFTIMPWWYWSFALLVSLFYAIRGVMEQKVLYRQKRHYISSPTTKCERLFILYIQEVCFKIIVTMSGFVALFICGHLFPTIAEINDISAGKALLLIFLFVWGVTGICGYLTLFIASGKIPAMK